MFTNKVAISRDSASIRFTSNVFWETKLIAVLQSKTTAFCPHIFDVVPEKCHGRKWIDLERVLNDKTSLSFRSRNNCFVLFLPLNTRMLSA